MNNNITNGENNNNNENNKNILNNNENEINKKILLIRRNLQEITGNDKLIEICSKRNLSIYWGTATTGKPHIGYFVPLLKIGDFIDAGCEIKILLADLHAYLDNMKAPWNLLEKRLLYYKILINIMLQSINIDISKVTFICGSEFQLTKEYILDLFKLSTISSLHDCKKAGSEVVKQLSYPVLGSYLYPGMQALDEEYLKVDAQFGGVDQRKIFMFAEKMLPMIGYKKRIHLMNPMVTGLDGSKMSSSEIDSKIDLLDTPENVRRKIKKSFCEEGNIERNACLAFCKYIIIPILKRKTGNENITIKRKEEHGGNLEITNYNELEHIFSNKLLHPSDLKNTVTLYLNEILSPIIKHFENDQYNTLQSQAYPIVDPKKTLLSGTNLLLFRIATIDSIKIHPEFEQYRIFYLSLAGKENTVICDCTSTDINSSLIGKNIVIVTNITPITIGTIVSNAALMMSKKFNILTGLYEYDMIYSGNECKISDTVYFSHEPYINKKRNKININDEILNSISENSIINENGEIEYMGGILRSNEGIHKTSLINGSLMLNKL